LDNKRYTFKEKKNANKQKRQQENKQAKHMQKGEKKVVGGGAGEGREGQGNKSCMQFIARRELTNKLKRLNAMTSPENDQ